MKKRLLSIVLTLLLCLTLLPVTALAASTTINPNSVTPVAVRGKAYDREQAVFWMSPADKSQNGNYTWSITDGNLPDGLEIISEQRYTDPEWCGVIQGTVENTAELKEYEFKVRAENKNDPNDFAILPWKIVVAEQVGGYYFLPGDGVPVTSGDELPVTITLQAGESVEVWSKDDDDRSNSTTFTAGTGTAQFTYRGSEQHNLAELAAIELVSGTVTLGYDDGVHATINGEMYTIDAYGSSAVTITANGTNGAMISTTGGASVTFAGNEFDFTAVSGQTAIMTITLTDTNTTVKIDDVASVNLNRTEMSITNNKYEKADLPALYPLYIEGVQVTSTTSSGTDWNYNAATKTLTLQNGASLSGQEVSTYGDHAAAIYYHGSGSDNFTIELNGDSTVTSGNSSTGWASAIEVVGADLTIQGDGSLTANGGNYTETTGNYGSAGIQVINGSLTITEDVTITASADGNGDYNTYNHGITAAEGITIGGNAKVTASSNGDGIWLEGNNQTITIGGTAQVIATGSNTDEECGIGGRPGTTLKIEGSAYVKASGGRAIDIDSGINIYETLAGNDYNIRTTTNGEAKVYPRSAFPAPFNWENTTYFEMPYNGNVYRVTYDGNGETSGNAPTDSNFYPAGASVTVLGNIGTLEKTGFDFGGWSLNTNGTGTLYGPDHTTTYTINSDTTFYAVWTAAPVTPPPPPPPPADDYDEPTYRITVEETDNGEVKSSHRWAYGGTTITLTVTPEAGYALSALTVTDSRGNEIELTGKGAGVYTFRMPYRDVTVRAAFEYDLWNLGYRDCPRDHTCPYWPYTDTDTHAWYHDGVHFCVENGLMVGYGDNIFKPNNSTTRAMITVMLWRLEGSPVVNYLLDFEDVPAEAWYTEAIRWAKSEGVAEGYGNGFFGPDDDVTREQMVTILWRYAKYKGYDVSVGEDTNILSYDDAFDVAEYAIPAMQWACGSGMIVGKDDPDGEGMILDPRGVTTRAQMATMMMRFCAEIVK